MRRTLLLVAFASACRAGPEEIAVRERGGLAPVPAPASPGATAPSDAPALDAELPLAGRLHYRELVTGGASPDAPLPMIVAIHGLGDDPDGFAGLVDDFDRPARVILPRAIDAWEGGGWSWFPIRARDQDVEALARGIATAEAMIADSVDELRRTRPTVGKPIVTGFSQGGMLAFALAVRHPESFSAAYPVGGWLPPPLWPEPVADPPAYPPIVALHGDADPAVRLGPTQDAVARLESQGVPVELRVYAGVKHAISPQMREELHRLLGEAHERARRE